MRALSSLSLASCLGPPKNSFHDWLQASSISLKRFDPSLHTFPGVTRVVNIFSYLFSLCWFGSGGGGGDNTIEQSERSLEDIALIVH